jgi:hypothetical protein
MKSEVVCSLLIIAFLGLVLLIVDRHLRISQFIEPFDGTINAQCGVDLPPCDFPLRCINGYCKAEKSKHMPVSTGLPVLP